jgi:hypothetical protein
LAANQDASVLDGKKVTRAAILDKRRLCSMKNYENHPLAISVAESLGEHQKCK